MSGVIYMLHWQVSASHFYVEFMQAEDIAHGQRSESEGMAKHWIESPLWYSFYEGEKLLSYNHKHYIFKSSFMKLNWYRIFFS